MTSMAEFVDALELAMRTHCKDGDYDLEPDDETGVVEVTTDDWTLSIETALVKPLAFLSIDNEPDEALEYVRALHDVMRPTELRALADANLELEGALATALAASEDPFSKYLGTAISAP